MKILVVDDHVLIREALRGVLIELIGNEAVVLEAQSARQALRVLDQNPEIELILLDLVLPDQNGIVMLSELRERYPAVAVVVLSALDDRERITNALNLGALGFIPKSAGREVMLSALNLVFSGGVYIPPEILGFGDSRQELTSPANLLPPRRVSNRDLGLTKRQMEVLTLMMHGKSNKAICRELNLAEPTVKIHVSAILKALNVTNRTEAVIVAANCGVNPSRAPD